MLEIIKVLNSSVALVKYNGQEVVALGKGIGYGKKPGQTIEVSAVDKMFYSMNDNKVSTYIQYAEAIPSIYFELTQDTIDYAEKLMQVKLNNGVYFTLTDHIQFAIERFKEGVNLINRVLWEIRAYYPNEFQVGIYMLNRIKEEFDIELPDEEAANIAFHIINARQENDVHLDTLKSAKIINNIVTIVKYAIGLNESEDTVHFQRFIVHVRFFVERLLTNKMLDDEDSILFEHVYKEYGAAVQIADKLEQYVEKSQGIVISNEELMYLIIHVDRLIKGNAK